MPALEQDDPFGSICALVAVDTVGAAHVTGGLHSFDAALVRLGIGAMFGTRGGHSASENSLHPLRAEYSSGGLRRTFAFSPSASAVGLA